MERRTNMMHVKNRKLKKVIICLYCLGFLLIFSAPSMAADPYLLSSSGSAFIDWSKMTISVNNSATITWSEKNSFSAAWSGLNGRQTDPGDSDFFEYVIPDSGLPSPPVWVGTSFDSAPLSGPLGNASGHADTNAALVPADSNPLPGPADEIFAGSAVNLKLLGEGDVFIAQAVLEGLFTVSADCTLTVTAPYELVQTLTSTFGRSAFSDVSVSLALYDFNSTDNITGNSKLLTESTVPLRNELKSLLKQTKAYTPPGGPTGTLSLTYQLKAFDLNNNPIVYDFEASSSTVAGAGLPLFRGFPFWWWHRCLVK
jgi:hypothetical protein